MIMFCFVKLWDNDQINNDYILHIFYLIKLMILLKTVLQG